jgi:hypothetical protein
MRILVAILERMFVQVNKNLIREHAIMYQCKFLSGYVMYILQVSEDGV